MSKLEKVEVQMTYESLYRREKSPYELDKGNTNPYRLTSCNCHAGVHIDEFTGNPSLDYVSRTRFCPTCGTLIEIEKVNPEEIKELRSDLCKLALEIEVLKPFNFHTTKRKSPEIERELCNKRKLFFEKRARLDQIR